jgi:hypothetical protein
LSLSSLPKNLYPQSLQHSEKWNTDHRSDSKCSNSHLKKQKSKKSREHGLTAIIPATQEAEIGRIMV